MKISIINLFTILVTSVEFSALTGNQAQGLQLPGSSLLAFRPIFAMAAFILGGLLTRWKLWTGRLVQSLVIPIMVCPLMIYAGCIHTINTPSPLSYAQLKSFKSHFDVLAVRENGHSSSRVLVAKKNFKPEMQTMLQEMTATSGTNR